MQICILIVSVIGLCLDMWDTDWESFPDRCDTEKQKEELDADRNRDAAELWKWLRQPFWSQSKALSFLFHMQIKISKGIYTQAIKT